MGGTLLLRWGALHVLFLSLDELREAQEVLSARIARREGQAGAAVKRQRAVEAEADAPLAKQAQELMAAARAEAQALRGRKVAPPPPRVVEDGDTFNLPGVTSGKTG